MAGPSERAGFIDAPVIGLYNGDHSDNNNNNNRNGKSVTEQPDSIEYLYFSSSSPHIYIDTYPPINPIAANAAPTAKAALAPTT